MNWKALLKLIAQVVVAWLAEWLNPPAPTSTKPQPTATVPTFSALVAHNNAIWPTKSADAPPAK